MNTLLMSPFSVRVRPNRGLYDFNNWVNRVAENEVNPLVKKSFNDVAVPLVNINKTEKAYELFLSVPGYSKDQIKLTVDKNILSVEGSLTAESKENETYTQKEFKLKDFKRSFILPDNTDLEQITASALNGVLTISIPIKVEETKKPQTINID